MKEGSSRDHEFLVSRARGSDQVRNCPPNATYVSAVARPESVISIRTATRLTHMVIDRFEHLLGRDDQRGHFPYCNLFTASIPRSPPYRRQFSPPPKEDTRKRTSKSICGYLKILRKNTGNRIVDRSLAPAAVYRGVLLCGEKVVRLGGGE
jgi:hypothetical protein